MLLQSEVMSRLFCQKTILYFTFIRMESVIGVFDIVEICFESV